MMILLCCLLSGLEHTFWTLAESPKNLNHPFALFFSRNMSSRIKVVAKHFSTHYFQSSLGSGCHAGDSSNSLCSFLIIPRQDHHWVLACQPLARRLYLQQEDSKAQGIPFFPSSFAYETCNLSCWQSMAPCGHSASLGIIIQRLSLIVPCQPVMGRRRRGVLLTSLVEREDDPDDIMWSDRGSCSLNPL